MAKYGGNPRVQVVVSVNPNPIHGGTTGEAAGEHAPRPKFSRRPASFSRPAPGAGPIAAPAAAPIPTSTDALEPLAATQPNRVPTLVTNAWQEDARFGVVMLVLVLLVNLALVYGLPLLPHGNVVRGNDQITFKAPTMSDAVGRTPASVTLYSQPEEERRTIYMLDLHNTASQQGVLSVSPNDTPPPIARALDIEN